jgi:hypothetical protein
MRVEVTFALAHSSSAASYVHDLRRASTCLLCLNTSHSRNGSSVKRRIYGCSDIKPRKRTGALLVYPAKIKIAPNKAKGGTPAMGFALVLPETEEHQRIAFCVRSSSNPNAVVVKRRRRR